MNSSSKTEKNECCHFFFFLFVCSYVSLQAIRLSHSCVWDGGQGFHSNLKRSKMVGHLLTGHKAIVPCFYDHDKLIALRILLFLLLKASYREKLAMCVLELYYCLSILLLQSFSFFFFFPLLRSQRRLSHLKPKEL